MCLVAAISVVCLASWLRDRRTAHLAIVAGLATGVAVVLAVNWVVYGLPLGAHVLQMEDPAALGRIEDSASRPYIVAALTGNFLRYNPVSIFVLLALALLPSVRRREDVRRLLTVIAIVLAEVPWIVPNSGGLQLGPRYLLQITPALYLLMTILLGEALGARDGWRRTTLLACLALCGLFGVWINAVSASIKLHDAETSRRLALNQLLAEPTEIVAVDDTVIAQEMEAAMGRHLFFLADTPERQRLLAGAAVASGHSELLFMTAIGARTGAAPMWSLGPHGSEVRFLCRAAGGYQICRARLPSPRAT